MNDHQPHMEAPVSKEHHGRSADFDLFEKDNSDATNSEPSASNNQLLNRRTVKHRVLDYLLSGGALTPGDAWSRFGTSRLAAIVHVLRHDGYAIRAEIVAVSRTGERVAHVARYSLDSRL